MIYFIQQQKNLLIKIGYTDADGPDGRLRAGQTWNPDGLTVLLTMPGGRDLEKCLHRMLAEAHVAGEWFKPTPEVLKYVVTSAAAEAVGGAAFLPRPCDASGPIRFYFAGKMGDWRRPFVDDSFFDGSPDFQEGRWPVRPLRKQWSDRPGVYVGPYRVECGNHGACLGEDSHGFDAQRECGSNCALEALSRGHDKSNAAAIVDLCDRAIRSCDVVFAWVDQNDCYGTVSEIGFAAALGKSIWIAGPRYFRDMWFVYRLATKHGLYCADPLDAFEQLCACRPAANLRGGRPCPSA